MPVRGRADTPEEQIEKLRKDQQKAQKEIEQLQAELEVLRKENKNREVREEAAERLRKENKDREEKNKRLMEEVEELLKKYPSLKDPPYMSSQQLRYPQPLGKIKGTITVTVENLAIISIGRDQGVTGDLICQVYRLEPAQKYLGTLTITNVEKNRAAGTFTPATKDATIMKGDAVDWVMIPK
jgi:hypothetical protein